jgi:hypothetical protein
MNCRHSLLLLSMILFSPLLQAETQEDDEAPSLELLEFLGEWETSDGEWIDPEELEDDDFAKLMSLTGDEDE